MSCPKAELLAEGFLAIRAGQMTKATEDGIKVEYMTLNWRKKTKTTDDGKHTKESNTGSMEGEQEVEVGR